MGKHTGYGTTPIYDIQKMTACLQEKKEVTVVYVEKETMLRSLNQNRGSSRGARR